MAQQFLLSPFALLFSKGRRRGHSTQWGVTGRDGSASSTPLPGMKAPGTHSCSSPHQGGGLGEGRDPAAMARVPLAWEPPLAKGTKWDWKCWRTSGQAGDTVGTAEGESQRKTPGTESTHVFLNAVYLKCPAEMLPALSSSHTSLPLSPAHCSAG